MTTAALTLPPPRRKARVKQVPGATLPLPSALPHSPFTHYEATYSQGRISVRDPRQAEALWQNGYFGDGAAVAGGSGRPRGRKKWRLVEAEGLKSGKWFKDAHETARKRGEKGGAEERGDGVEENVSEMKDLSEGKEKEEEVVDMKEEEKERKMEEGNGLENMEEVKEETIDKEGKREEEEKINVKEVTGIEKEENEAEKEILNTEKNERGKEETKREEEDGDNTNSKTPLEHHEEEIEDSDKEFTDNYEEEMEMLSGSEELEPWRTVLELSADQKAAKNTYNSHTYLSLLPEEALFLSYALGCLVLTCEEPPASRQPGKRALVEQDTHEMTIDEMWRVFTLDDPAFPVKYAAFHHFRTKGWVVKSGLKYGVDYVLYPVGPPFYHSQYAVKIHSVWADTMTLDHSLPGHGMTWTTIATTERLANHVNKTPVICFVMRPRSLTQSSLARIDCLKELKLQEMVLGRWNPSDGSG